MCTINKQTWVEWSKLVTKDNRKAEQLYLKSSIKNLLLLALQLCNSFLDIYMYISVTNTYYNYSCILLIKSSTL